MSVIDQMIESYAHLGVGIKYVNISAVVNGRGPVEGGWIYETVSEMADTKHDSTELVTMLSIHGGGYQSGYALKSLKYLWQMCRRFNAEAAKTGSKKRLVIFSLEYPLFSMDAALNAATDAYQWLVKEVGVKSLIVGGDSAGGHCSIELINKIKNTASLSALPVQISSAILLSPAVQFDDFPTDSRHYNDLLLSNPKFEKFDEILSFELEIMSKVTDGRPLNDPQVSPIYIQDMAIPEKGFFIDYGKAEILGVQIEKFISKIPKDKVQVQASEGMFHTYTPTIQNMENVDPVCLRYSDESIDRSISFLVKNYAAI